MGIYGLKWYMYENSDVFFEEYKLRDTQLVIDGYCVAVQIYRDLQNVSFFGGDYDVYYEAVKCFFCRLKKCNVEAIVIFDGGMVQKKMSTYFQRAEARMAILRDFQRTFWKNVFVPLFLFTTFENVLIDLNIKYMKCWFEADQEVASLACFLNCPVLSFDSDFFIYGCLYIPFDKADFHRFYVDSSTYPPSVYMKCMIYNIASFENHVGKDKSLLPFVAAFLGNDYVNCKIFEKFFEHLSFHNGKNNSILTKVRAVIAWLRNESLETAKSNILKHLRKKDVAKASRAIDLILESYEIIHPTVLYHLQGDSIELIKGTMNFKCRRNLSKLPDKFVEGYMKNKVPSVIIDMVTLQKYRPMIQVEDVTQSSSHSLSFPIVGAIYYLVRQLTGITGKLKAMLKMFQSYKEITLDYNAKYMGRVDANSVIFGPVDGKINFMYDVLSLDESDISQIEMYDEGWRILVMSFVYWLKNSISDVSETHFHSILLMILANYGQRSVGYFKNYSSFMKIKAGALNRLSKTSAVLKDTGNSLSDMLDSITELEYLKLTEKFIKLRQYEKEVTEPGYFMRTLHAFATFQSVLYHVMDLNQVLDCPLPRTRIHEIYTGTLVYNIYYKLMKKKDIPEFVEKLLETEPNVLRVYKFFVDTLVRYIPTGNRRENRTRPLMTRRQRRRRRRRNRK